jgi:flagellar protein FliS
MLNNATQSYRQAQVNTIGRADITLMLYDGLLRFLDLAADKMEQHKIQEKGNYISRALDIINELDSTLNMEKGGEVSKGLHNLYILTNKNLLMANLKNDISILKSVRSNMQVVRDSFYEAMQTQEAKEMLSKMGPVPVQSGNNNMQVTLGGSIQERVNKIKEAQQKADAIKKIQANLANAKTEEEKAMFKKELEELLGKNIVKTQNKPVSMSMAQKANRAFMQQQGFAAPTMQLKTAGQSNTANTVQENAAPQASQTVQQLMENNEAQSQPALNPQTMHAIKNAYAPQDHMQSPMQPAEQISENVVNGTPLQNCASLTSQIGTQTGAPMGGLLGKKLSLYKNS